MTISVLMSTYIKEQPNYLDEAMRSIWTEQTRKPDQIVLVEDGPLTTALYGILSKWQNVIGDKLTIIENKQNKGLALSREKILNSVWDYDYFGDARTIDTHVKKLRSKLGDCGNYIHTIWGMGYKFEVEDK